MQKEKIAAIIRKNRWEKTGNQILNILKNKGLDIEDIYQALQSEGYEVEINGIVATISDKPQTKSLNRFFRLDASNLPVLT